MWHTRGTQPIDSYWQGAPACRQWGERRWLELQWQHCLLHHGLVLSAGSPRPRCSARHGCQAHLPRMSLQLVRAPPALSNLQVRPIRMGSRGRMSATEERVLPVEGRKTDGWTTVPDD